MLWTFDPLKYGCSFPQSWVKVTHRSAVMRNWRKFQGKKSSRTIGLPRTFKLIWWHSVIPGGTRAFIEAGKKAAVKTARDEYVEQKLVNWQPRTRHLLPVKVQDGSDPLCSCALSEVTITDHEANNNHDIITLVLQQLWCYSDYDIISVKLWRLNSTSNDLQIVVQ